MRGNRDLKMRLMLEAEKELTQDFSEVQRYQYYLGRMQFLHYVSGKENLLQADCSGSVCPGETEIWERMFYIYKF